MLGATLLTAAALAFGADPQAPVLVHDAADTSPASRVPRDRPGTVAYRRTTGRSVQSRGLRPLQPRSACGTSPGQGGLPQDRGIVRTGRHAGDWELFQVRLDARGRPDEVVVGQHSGAERCAGARLLRRGGHPVVWVANGSHALYLRDGTRDRTFPDPNDEARGGGAVLRPVIQPITARAPAWMRFPGRWGATPRRAWIP